MFTFNLEMLQGQSPRYVDADSFKWVDGWMVFYRKLATGGTIEYWRVRLEFVVSMETGKAF